MVFYCFWISKVDFVRNLFVTFHLTCVFDVSERSLDVLMLRAGTPVKTVRPAVGPVPAELVAAVVAAAVEEAADFVAAGLKIRSK